MSRRAFLGALGVSGAALAGGLRAPRIATSQTLGTGTPAAPPTMGAPAVADTLDFQAAARRALDGLLARLDPAEGFRPHFLFDLTGPSAQLEHDDYWDSVDLAGRTVDALIRLRRLLGGDPSDAELNLRNLFLSHQGDLGLFYNDGANPVADSFCQSRALLGLTSWFASSGDAEIEARLHWLIDGLATIAESADDYSYFPGRGFRDRWLDYGLTRAEAYDHLDNFGYASQSALPLMQYHALARYAPARDLAGRLLRHFMFHAGLVDDEGHFAGETHAGGYLAMGVAAVRYGIATSDERYVAWADRLYRWVRANSSEFGWVPGPLGLGSAYFQLWYGAPVRRTCETCSLADALDLAIVLAKQGHPEYWDDVDRFARNQLLQNQFGSAETVLGVEACKHVPPDVQRALAGAWESFALPYRLLARPDDRRLVEGCCSGSGSRALSLVWEHAVEQRGGQLYVHLGLSHSGGLARVVSHEPREGRLDVVPAAATALRLRVPSWAAPDSVTLWVDDAQRDVRRAGSYVALDEVPAGSRVSLRYGLVERTEAFTANDETTLAHWRGGTVLSVEPDHGPMAIYQARRSSGPALGTGGGAGAAPGGPASS
ncbi:MAG TPA: twin-arginine translocation signal domain-containing protein [Chloroflexota bacterium]